MGLAAGPVGPRGLALLAVTAVTGLILAVHGWDTPRSAAPGGLALSGGTPTANASAPAPSTSAAPGPAGPPAGPTAGPTAPPGHTRPGPLLRTEPFASYAFQIWPGTPGTAARAAMTGLSVSVHQAGRGIAVTAGAAGQPAGSPHLYRGGVRVYVVESSMGDDSNASDYNLGDDGLVVTDAQGRILQ